jgi:hypothetical protein
MIVALPRSSGLTGSLFRLLAKFCRRPSSAQTPHSRLNAYCIRNSSRICYYSMTLGRARPNKMI